MSETCCLHVLSRIIILYIGCRDTCFSSCDLDHDPMTLVLDLDLDVLMLYLPTENEMLYTGCIVLYEVKLCNCSHYIYSHSTHSCLNIVAGKYNCVCGNQLWNNGESVWSEESIKSN